MRVGLTLFEPKLFENKLEYEDEKWQWHMHLCRNYIYHNIYNVASESVLKPCIKNDYPRVA